jgi:putative addiction module CopG family antidote
MGGTEDHPMTLTLPPDLERFVQDQVANGQYPSTGGVVEAALQLFRARHAELRELVRVATDQADRGEVAPLDPVATLTRLKAAHAGAEG